ncbi:MAG: hypothetical protein ABEJ55_06810 [Halanaeroarchaeum sp.]
MEVDLPVPEEPTDLKAVVARNVEDSSVEFEEDVDWRLPHAEEAPGRILLGTEIQAYLWRAWEDDLRDRGLSFLEFRNVLTHAAAAMNRWATGDGSWTSVVMKVEETLAEMGDVLSGALAQ